MNINNIKHWSKKDFFDNSYFWEENFNSSYKIRLDNLKELFFILEKNNLFFFLEGKTLLSVCVLQKLLINDHDDDIGIFSSDREKLLSLENTFKKSGFEIIRVNENMISLLRNYRYIDICLFSRKRGEIGYGNKKFPLENYQQFENISFNDCITSIPRKSLELINKRYNVKKVLNIYRKNLYKKKLYLIFKLLIQNIYCVFSTEAKKLMPGEEVEYKDSKISAKFSVSIPVEKIYVNKLVNGRRNEIKLLETIKETSFKTSGSPHTKDSYQIDNPIFFKFEYDFLHIKKRVFILNDNDLKISNRRTIFGYLIK